MDSSKTSTEASIAERLKAADKPYPTEELARVKSKIIPAEDEAAIVRSWAEILEELKAFEKELELQGSDIIPQLEFSELANVTEEQKATIKRFGSVLIKNIVDDDEVLEWKEGLKEYVKANPQIKGWPDEHIQFFYVYWSAPQVKARTHPNVIATQAFVNSLWTKPPSADNIVSTSNPISWADRFRIRPPGGPKEPWKRLAPHVDGPQIARWSDPNVRACFTEIYEGRWREHDPYRIEARIAAKSKSPGASGSTTFMAWQAWLAMSNTGPGEGTLKLFPNPKLSSAYVILRPFFRLRSPDADPLLASNWIFDPNTGDFPGVIPGLSLRINEDTHPNLNIAKNLVPVPRVHPGDMVYWHGDVVHTVEEEHNGPNDSSVMYIGSLPLTLGNAVYIARQRESFLSGALPPDFKARGAGEGETDFKGRASEKDVRSIEGRRALGLESFAPKEGMSEAEKNMLKEANRLIAV